MTKPKQAKGRGAGAVVQGKGNSRVTVGIKTLPVEETHSSSDAGAVQSAPSRARTTVVEAVLEHIRTGTPIRNAFALEDVPKRTAYDWMEADEGLRNAVDKARAIASETRRKVFEAEPSAPMLHYMQTLDPESFPPPKTRTEVSGPEGKPQEHRVVLTTEQRNAGARDGSVPEEV